MFNNLFLWIFIGVFASCSHIAFALEKPNIVLLYVDDWAWNGSPVAMHDDMPKRLCRGTPDHLEEVLWGSPKPAGKGPYKLGITASKRLAIFQGEGKTATIDWLSPVKK